MRQEFFLCQCSAQTFVSLLLPLSAISLCLSFFYLSTYAALYDSFTSARHDIDMGSGTVPRAQLCPQSRADERPPDVPYQLTNGSL